MKKSLVSLFMFIFCLTLSLVLLSCSSDKEVTTTTENITTFSVEYEVKFFSDGEALISSSSVEALEVISLSAAPVKDHFSFKGWTDGVETYQAGSSYIVIKDVSFTPVWEEHEKYSVTLSGGEGSVGTAPVVESKYAGEIVVLPANPFSKEHYTFIGWSDGENTYDDNENYIVRSADVVLQAVWDENEKHSITFLGGDDSVGTAPNLDSQYAYDQLVLPSSPFYKNDCAFGGWSDGEATYNVGDIFTIPDSDITLNAIWIQATEGLDYSSIEGQESLYLTEYSGSSTEVFIPDMHDDKLVKNIRYETFYNNDSITSITISRSIEDIGYQAFANCDALENIYLPSDSRLASVHIEAFTGSAWYNDLPDGVVYLGTRACLYKGVVPENFNLVLKEGTTCILQGFMEQEENLISVTLPDSLTKIDNAAFCLCENLEALIYSENCNVEFVGANALLETKWCDNLPIGQTYIGRVAYRYVGEAPVGTTITFKEGTVCISGASFDRSNRLISVLIPSTVTYIQRDIFFDCYSIESLTVEEENPVYYSVGNCIIEKNTGILVQGCRTSIIPNDGSVKEIGSYSFTFRRVYEPETLVIPNSVVAIGERAFYGCGNMRSIVISENVESIGSYAFSQCLSLKKVTIDSQYIASDLYAQVSTTDLLDDASTVYIKDDLDIADQEWFLSKYSKASSSDKFGYDMYEINLEE